MTETKTTEAKKPEKEEKSESEREYIIPLRRSLNRVPRYKKANKAVKTIKEFLARHMKVPDRNLKNVKLDMYLNEFIWARGIRNPPSKIKVKVTKEGDIVKAGLSELPEFIKFKKERFEKRDRAAETKKKVVPKETKPEEKTEEEKTEEKEEKKESEEKKAAVVEAGKEIEKAAAKRTKHQTKISKQPKHQRRMALKK